MASLTREFQTLVNFLTISKARLVRMGFGHYAVLIGTQTKIIRGTHRYSFFG